MNRTWLLAAGHRWAGSKASLRSGRGTLTSMTDLAEPLPAGDTQPPRPGAVRYVWRSQTLPNEKDSVDKCLHDRY